jgi:hypothetical protein
MGGKPVIPLPTPVYHITHIGNLPSIMARGGLECCRTLQRAAIGYTDIAHQHIQDRRARTLVPCGPGGVLHDYVPFYFAPRSPMLFTISRGNVQGYDEGQAPVVCLMSTAQKIQEMGLRLAFTDGHGTMGYTDFFDTLGELTQVDWAIMRARYWSDTNQDNDRRRRRQAEFLVWKLVPWAAILEIGVMDSRVQGAVRALLRGGMDQPPIKVHRDWYY